MGKRFDLAYLQEQESEMILDVLEKDFQLRLKERDRLSKIKKRIHEDDRRARLLADQREFNDTCCIRCFRRFMLLLVPRFRCYACGFNVCRKCCTFFQQFRDFVCNTCQMEKDVMAQSCNWFYETVQRKFRQSGSAKVVRRLSASYKDRGKDIPMTGKMRTSVLLAFPDGKEALPIEVLSTPESSEDEGNEDPECQKSREVATRPKERAPENSQREVLRRMKSLQITRFHERMHEAMSKIGAALLDRYPQGLPTPSHRADFRKFIHKSKEELTVILKNFSQILAITIESHNLAMGKTSEDVQIDIQYILQDEVEGIVSRRIDVVPRKNFDDSSSFITDDGSRSGQTNNVEAKLSIVILRKLLDDHRHSSGDARLCLQEEEEMLRTFDAIVESGSSSSFRRRPFSARREYATGSPREVDPDLLSLSNVSFGQSGSGNRPRSDAGSHRSTASGSGSGSRWLTAGARPGGVGERSRLTDRSGDDISDLSCGSDAELGVIGFDCAAFSDVSGPELGTPWAGTSSETEKKFLLQQLSQQHDQNNTQLSDNARVTRVSHSLMAANQSVTGAAVDLQSSAGQLDAIFKQLSLLDNYIDNVSAKYTPATALRVTSDQGVKAAAKVLQNLPASKQSDPDRAKLEEDIYAKAAEMASVAELIEELEDCLLLTAGHPTECPQHLERWSSIDERVVSLVTRLEGDLHDVDRIQARIGTTILFDSALKPPEGAAVVESRSPQPSASNSEVSFGYRPPSRNAWEEYKNS